MHDYVLDTVPGGSSGHALIFLVARGESLSPFADPLVSVSIGFNAGKLIWAGVAGAFKSIVDFNLSLFSSLLLPAKNKRRKMLTILEIIFDIEKQFVSHFLESLKSIQINSKIAQEVLFSHQI